MNSPRLLPPPRGTWRIGRLGEVELLIKPSLLVMGAVLVLLFAPRYEDAETSPYLLAGAFVVALYVSVFVHELAHVGVARSFGMRVPSVTLHLLGGETLVEGESHSPWQEFSTAVAGPLTSVAIGFAALFASRPMGESVFHDLVWSIAYVNIVVAIFNMLPGLPLDGGRVFKALIWLVTGSELTGTRIAGWIGRLAALGLASAAVFLVMNNQITTISVLIMGMIAWFLWQGSSDALSGSDRMRRINRLEARALAQPADVAPSDAVPIFAHLSGADLLRAMADRPADRYALINEEGSLVGILHARDVDSAYRASQR